jgi:hypothetical protein
MQIIEGSQDRTVPMGDVGGQRLGALWSADGDPQELTRKDIDSSTAYKSKRAVACAITVGAEVARPTNVVAETSGGRRAWDVIVARRRRAWDVIIAHRRRHGNEKGKADDNEQQGERSRDNGSIHVDPSFRIRLSRAHRISAHQRRLGEGHGPYNIRAVARGLDDRWISE